VGVGLVNLSLLTMWAPPLAYMPRPNSINYTKFAPDLQLASSVGCQDCRDFHLVLYVVVISDGCINAITRP
jgi:hypothetical protein